MKIPFRRSHWLLWLPVVLYYALITYLSGLEGRQISRFPFQPPDKLVHFLEFAFLGALLARACLWETYYRHLSRRTALAFLLLFPVLAVADELHQHFVPGRMMDWKDWLADLSGGLSGMTAYWFFYRRRLKGRVIP